MTDPKDGAEAGRNEFLVNHSTLPGGVHMLRGSLGTARMTFVMPGDIDIGLVADLAVTVLWAVSLKGGMDRGEFVAGMLSKIRTVTDREFTETTL